VTCELVDLGDGGVAIVCTRGRRRASCSHCGRHAATLLCDFPLKGKKAGRTCDRKLCPKCAVHLGEADYCPPHSMMEQLGGDR